MSHITELETQRGMYAEDNSYNKKVKGSPRCLTLDDRIKLRWKDGRTGGPSSVDQKA
jgi:hypothetical protein